jgi:hypothetical protein
VNALRHDLVTDAALPSDEDLGVGLGNPIHLLLERNDFRAASDELDMTLRLHCRYWTHAGPLAIH